MAKGSDEVSRTSEDVEEFNRHAGLELWQSYCDKKMKLEDLQELVVPLIAYLETYIDECHAEDVVCERELITKIKRILT